MRTVRSSSRPGGSPPGTPPGAGTPWDKAHPSQDQAPQSRLPVGPGIPRPDPPQLPPWLWAWTRSPSISPLAVGLDQMPLHFPLGCGAWRTPPGDLLGYHLQYMLGYHPPETYCKTCWDTTCNACWDSTPHVDRHTPVNLLPCPKLRLRAVITMIKELH